MDQDEAIKALRLAATNEQDTRQFYLDAAERTDDACGKEMFEWLADEESKHLKMVERQYMALESGEGWVEFAESAAEEEFPPLERRKELEKPVDPTTSDLDALLFAIQMENDAYEFYRQEHEKTQDPVGRQLYCYLAAAERSHFDMFMQNYEYMTETGGYLGLSARKCE